MTEPPCDIGGPQEEFEEHVISLFDDPGSGYEILDTNLADDPFEPDILLMDADEWVFTVLCYYVEDIPDDGVVWIFPRTFGMRKWVTDTDERPAFLVLGVGGTPHNPEYLYFGRFYDFPESDFHMEAGRRLLMNWFRMDFIDKAIRDEFERIFSPS